jgi:hypothetical protein
MLSHASFFSHYFNRVALDIASALPAAMIGFAG